MRKLFAAAAMVAALGAAGAAGATAFTGSYSATYYGSSSSDGNNGLAVDLQDSTPGSGTGFGFNLVNNGDFANVNLFKIYTQEHEVDSDDGIHKAISVLFNFTAPGVANGAVNGETWAIDGSINRGVVTWNGPAVINFGGGFGTLTVTLNNAEFAQNSSNGDNLSGQKAQITGKFTLSNVGAAVGAVPEPATWGMMIMGFGLTGATLRRRRTVALAA